VTYKVREVPFHPFHATLRWSENIPVMGGVGISSEGGFSLVLPVAHELLSPWFASSRGTLACSYVW